MKRYFLPIVVLLGLFLTIGCEKIEEDWIVDWAPVNIYITATDDNGNSIISPDMPGMTLTFKGETYMVKDWETRCSEVQTRAYLATLWGLFAQQNSDSDVKTPYRLYFGEIDGAADMDEDIVLKWPDGSSDTIHYHCSHHKGGKNASCDRSWKLNGKAHRGDSFSFSGKNIPESGGIFIDGKRIVTIGSTFWGGAIWDPGTGGSHRCHMYEKNFDHGPNMNEVPSVVSIDGFRYTGVSYSAPGQFIDGIVISRDVLNLDTPLEIPLEQGEYRGGCELVSSVIINSYDSGTVKDQQTGEMNNDGNIDIFITLTDGHILRIYYQGKIPYDGYY